MSTNERLDAARKELAEVDALLARFARIQQNAEYHRAKPPDIAPAVARREAAIEELNAAIEEAGLDE